MTTTQTAAALLSALRKGSDFAVTVAALCDLLEEEGHATGRDLRHLRSVKRRERWLCESMEERCVKAGLVTWDDCPCHQEAVALHARVAAVNLCDIPVMSRERRPGRTESAAMARRLFTLLKMKGISVTAPAYSMASTVDVKLPKRLDAVIVRDDNSGRLIECPAGKANRECEWKVKAILYAAFPETGDRSDSQTDYYDACWSFD